MKQFIYLVGVVVLVVSQTLVAQYQKVQVKVPDADAFKRLLSTGVDLEGATGKIGGWLEITAAKKDVSELQRQGFSTKTIIEDLQHFYAQRLAPGRYDALGFGYGSMGGNYTLNEVIQQLDSMNFLYPNLISYRFSAGLSFLGNTIWGIKMANNPNIPNDNPEVLYTALTHAREPQGMMNLIYFMWYLLEHYGTDAEATYLLDNRQLYFIPVVNPDGYEANRRISPTGGGMRRKNMRGVTFDDDSYGVDLNRNYGYQWGYDDNGSSPNQTYETYRGAYGFSEMETSTIRFLCTMHNFKVAFNYHTFSNLLLYPWDYTPDFQCPDSLIFHDYARDITKYNHYTYGPSGKTLYLVNGGATDWMYGEQMEKNKIISFLPEVGSSSDGFWPPSERILPLAQENLYPNLYLANVAGSYPKIGEIWLEDENADGYFEPGELFTMFVRVKNKGLDSTGEVMLSLSAANSFLSLSQTEVPVGKLASQGEMEFAIPGSVSVSTPPGTFSSIYTQLNEGGERAIYDTMSVYIGTMVVAFADSAENGTTNWDTGISWGLSEPIESPTNSFTDSPTGAYTDGTDNSMTLTAPIDLSQAKKMKLTFLARWEVEKDWDFTTVEFSSDGGSVWSTVPGKYSRGGSGNGVQATGTNGYDGYQYDWVKEELDITSFISPNFKMRFRMRSDDYITYDGFYVDDITLLVGIGDAELSVEVQPRWNLISVPFKNDNVSKAAMFSNSISPAFAFSGNTYVQREDLQRREGYWLKFDSSRIVSIHGKTTLRDTFQLAEGWNLVGSISKRVSISSFITEPPSLISTSVYSYKRGYYIPDSLLPASAVWVKALSAGQLIVGASSFSGKTRNAVNKENIEKLNTLIIKDKLGNSQKLYFGSLEGLNIDGNMYELPPPPPVQSFDARFASGKFVELQSAEGKKEMPVQVNSAGLPLLIEWCMNQEQTGKALLSIEGKRIQLAGAGKVEIPNPDASIKLVMERAEKTIPGSYALEQNYPNPFNPTTVFSFQLPVSGYVTLKVFNLLGQEVATLVNGMQDAGYKTQAWDAPGMPSGVYYYRLTAGGFTEAKKLIITR